MIYSNLLLSNSNLDVQFFASLENHDFDSAKEFLRSGANIDLKDQYGNTLLMIAARDNEPEVAKFLIDNDVQINEINSNGSNAIILSARFNNDLISEMLLKSGANFLHKNDQGYSALNFACINKNFKILFLMFKIHFTKQCNIV
ncbi:ankyrin repeat domain-containing protein [Candidatus Dependentiae bacterium]|nr:ankyrin repeat domain-containing protein [Candidatus Dependentiae bacterium]